MVADDDEPRRRVDGSGSSGAWGFRSLSSPPPPPPPLLLLLSLQALWLTAVTGLAGVRLDGGDGFFEGEIPASHLTADLSLSPSISSGFWKLVLSWVLVHLHIWL